MLVPHLTPNSTVISGSVHQKRRLPLTHTWRAGSQMTQVSQTSTCCCHNEVICFWDHFCVLSNLTETGSSGMFPQSPLLQSLLLTSSGLQTMYGGFSWRTHSYCILGRKYLCMQPGSVHGFMAMKNTRGTWSSRDSGCSHFQLISLRAARVGGSTKSVLWAFLQ